MACMCTCVLRVVLLQFEGGVVPTATVVAGIFELGKKAGQRPAVSAVSH